MKKDFRFLKVGNKAIVLKDGDVWVVLYANETKSQEFETEAEARAFASKVGNESIDKQEWSMFNGLRKDAEKEIGNVLPPSGLYAKLLDEICEKEGIDSNKAREKYGQYSIEQWEKLLGRKIGNADTVSEYNAEIQRLTKKAEQLRRMGQGRSAMEIEKQIEKLGKEMRELGNSKTGNETKAERKFGKVMGEFEEGALKTPQGKTVTDPAQAKAIAYSEADKVDNLKRARNAMNKKVKNSSVREYKDSQGRIAQIDFNSDGTDADMAIYEDERMSKSVEQRNFSTIRDAEQYVQSHGFRRVG